MVQYLVPLWLVGMLPKLARSTVTLLPLRSTERCHKGLPGYNLVVCVWKRTFLGTAGAYTWLHPLAFHGNTQDCVVPRVCVMLCLSCLCHTIPSLIFHTL
jgi:hypothetical protein